MSAIDRLRHALVYVEVVVDLLSTAFDRQCSTVYNCM